MYFVPALRSVWKYQGRPSSQEAVRELVESFKIQIDNLCTFLPQDKVGSFTEHGARERLIEVEKALTKANLLKQHEELIDRQRYSFKLIRVCPLYVSL